MTDVHQQNPDLSPLLHEQIKLCKDKGLACHSDLYAVNISSHHNINISNLNYTIDLPTEIAKSFFGPSNRVFAPEHFLLTQLISWTNEPIKSPPLNEIVELDIGMQILLWKVVAKSSNEVILSWKWKDFNGFTLLGYDDTKNILYHGNMLPKKGSNAPSFFKLMHRFHMMYAFWLTAETSRVFGNRMSDVLIGDAMPSPLIQVARSDRTRSESGGR
jgi:hypothetical protein